MRSARAQRKAITFRLLMRLAGDEETAGDEEDVDRHFRKRKADMVEEEFLLRRKSENRDAVAEKDAQGRKEADEVEIVVPADGVLG